MKEINKEAKAQQRQQGLGRCGNSSEISGLNGCVETSHLDHDKRDAEVYLSPDTVVMCTPVEHYAYHLMFKNKAEMIGLLEHENEFAIRETFKRAVCYLKRHHGIDFKQITREEKIKIVSTAWNYWSYYLELPFYDEQ